MKNKELSEKLVEHLNDLSKDRLRDLRGSFKIKYALFSNSDNPLIFNKIHLALIYTDVSEYTVIDCSYGNDYGCNLSDSDINKAYGQFYKVLMNYIIFAKESDGSKFQVIPIDKLLKDGYER